MSASIRSARRLLLAVPLVLALAACAGGDANSAATVNGTDIPVEQLKERAERLKENPQFQAQAEQDPTAEDQVEPQMLSQLIQEQLIREAAADKDIEVTDEDAAEQREALIAQVGGEEAFAQAIEEQGFSEEELDDQLRLVAIQEQLFESFEGAAGEVSDEQVAEFYETQFLAQQPPPPSEEAAGARHILVEDEAAAQDALDRLEAGEDFAELAGELSTDPGSGENGGDLGPVEPGMMVPEFEEALFAAEEGEVVGPVESEFGFHVIERLPTPDAPEPPPLEEVEGQILEQLEGQAAQEAFTEYQVAQLTGAEIEVNPRFGEWDPETGTVIDADALGSEPAGEGAPAAPPSDDPAAEPDTAPTDG